MKIMKFGGASLGTGDRILHVADIIKTISSTEEILVVVSAMYNITDMLISFFEKNKMGQHKDALYILNLIHNVHNRALYDLDLSTKQFPNVNKSLYELFNDLHSYLENNNAFSARDYDYVISFGERFASLLAAAALNKINTKARPINASEILVADNNFGNGKVSIEKSIQKAQKRIFPLISGRVVPVVTGFFASTVDGEIITLGRGGSDYSATMLAHLLDATEVILWKEVDGVFSSDPKKDKNAAFYPNLSYDQALSLAEKGAKILHPEAMKPVASKGIVVRVKNTFKPHLPGTKIWNGQKSKSEQNWKGIAV